ncbi:MAG: MotA/TolQ/ExbB proton channel family protein [Thermoleophilia bacterium]|jgi:biopolymer transport protein ExbB/TolQ|nr:MotA/TolQ/ExbB proton channel family protein [Thermoleophilia bacterium]
MSALIVGSLARDIQEWIYNAAEILLYPVLIAALVCLVWVFVELGWLCYEIYLRIRFRDLEALEIRTLRARQAFIEGKPRKAYRYLQETRYSMVVARFLFDLIRNYQTQRLAVKPLKLLQEYEFYTVKRLERTRILVRVGPMLGLMGTLIPLAPALVGLAQGDTQQLADNLVLAFSVTVVGLLIGGIAFAVSIVRDRIYSQDISDLEYLLELLEGGGERLPAGGRRAAQTKAGPRPAPAEPAGAETAELPLDALVPGATVSETVAYVPEDDAAEDDAADGDDVPLPIDDPDMSWYREDDPFASLGPVESPDDDARPHADR